MGSNFTEGVNVQTLVGGVETVLGPVFWDFTLYLVQTAYFRVYRRKKNAIYYKQVNNTTILYRLFFLCASYAQAHFPLSLFYNSCFISTAVPSPLPPNFTFLCSEDLSVILNAPPDGS